MANKPIYVALRNEAAASSSHWSFSCCNGSSRLLSIAPCLHQHWACGCGARKIALIQIRKFTLKCDPTVKCFYELSFATRDSYCRAISRNLHCVLRIAHCVLLLLLSLSLSLSARYQQYVIYNFSFSREQVSLCAPFSFLLAGSNSADSIHTGSGILQRGRLVYELWADVIGA